MQDTKLLSVLSSWCWWVFGISQEYASFLFWYFKNTRLPSSTLGIEMQTLIVTSLPNLCSFWPNSVYIKWHCVYRVGTKYSDLSNNGICSVSNVWLYCIPLRAAIQVLKSYHTVGTCLSRPKVLGSSDPFKNIELQRWPQQFFFL